ncbi:hypothetical protein PHJA_002059300 [Phtheirospermum japonicum]|uniref:Uncharacterized protein n=1 Tax=Phtheirospermum japonicum TaxID=374723 RepID=A0A830CSQ0_9LAMI|nr:hypothetical protein PHJA_002059300 [Phtheirospermum japonicum]
MEAEMAQDPFVSIAKLCQPTASQEAKFPNFPLARESENFAGSNSEQFSSSPDPMPSEPTGIVMVSPPGSISSARQQAEDDAVFHTPPEHHFPAHFPSVDQNLDDLSSGGAKTVDVGDRCDRSKKARVSEAGMDDEFESNRIRDPGEEFGGETVPALDTEVIVDEIEGNEGVRDEAEVIILDSGDSGEEMAASDLADVSVKTINVGNELSKDSVRKANGINGDHKCESTEGIPVNKGKRPHDSGSLDSVKSKEEIVELKCIAGNGGSEMRHESGVGGSDKIAKDGKRIEKIDEFRYVGGGDSRRRQKEKTDGTAGDLGRRRQLPVSLEGKGKNAVEMVGLKSGLLDFLDVLKVVVGDVNGGCKDVDFLGMAKSRGLTFPRPRWWSAEDDEE